MITKPIDILIVVALLLTPLSVLIVGWVVRRHKERRVPRVRSEHDFSDIHEDSVPPVSDWLLGNRRRWIALASYELLVTAGIVLFYFNPELTTWRIHRDLIDLGISSTGDVSLRFLP